MVTRGFYKHWKGPVYFVESVSVLDNETRPIVVYQSTQRALDGRTRLRYEDEFEQWVWPRESPLPAGTPYEGRREDGAVLRAGGWVLRFEREEEDSDEDDGLGERLDDPRPEDDQAPTLAEEGD